MNEIKQKEDLSKGIIYMLIASFCFALTGACAKVMSADMSSIQIVFYRNIIGIGFILIPILYRPRPQIGGRLWLLIFRGVVGTMALYVFFYGIGHLGLATAITYQQSYPIFIAIVSYFIFNEVLSGREYLAVILGFIGVAAIFFPQISTHDFKLKSHLIGLSNPLLIGSAYLSIKGLSKYYDSRVIVLSFMVSGVILPIISMFIGAFYPSSELDFLVAKYVSITLKQVPWVVLIGIAALIGQIYLTKAFQFQKTGVIAAVGYSNILFSLIFGALLHDKWVGIVGTGGILLVIISGVLISYKQSD